MSELILHGEFYTEGFTHLQRHHQFYNSRLMLRRPTCFTPKTYSVNPICCYLDVQLYFQVIIRNWRPQHLGNLIGNLTSGTCFPHNLELFLAANFRPQIFYIEFFNSYIKDFFFYQGQHHLFPYPHKNFGVVLILKYFI